MITRTHFVVGAAEIVFDNVRIPAGNLVGEEGGAVKCMMRNLEIDPGLRFCSKIFEFMHFFRLRTRA